LSKQQKIWTNPSLISLPFNSLNYTLPTLGYLGPVEQGGSSQSINKKIVPRTAGLHVEALHVAARWLKN
jgi:hypothetical protein